MRIATNKATHQELRIRINALSLPAKRVSPVTGLKGTSLKYWRYTLLCGGPRTCPPVRKWIKLKGSGTKPQNFEKEKEILLQNLDRFRQQPRGFNPGAHPMFGPLTASQWDLWAYLHIDHLLRQFGR